MSKHRAIGQRLKSASSPEALHATLTDWAADWRRDQMDVLRQLELALGDDPDRIDYDALCRATGQLRAVTEKRFDGLAGVIRRLTEQQPKT